MKKAPGSWEKDERVPTYETQWLRLPFCMAAIFPTCFTRRMTTFFHVLTCPSATEEILAFSGCLLKKVESDP